MLLARVLWALSMLAAVLGERMWRGNDPELIKDVKEVCLNSKMYEVDRLCRQ
jgi:hypothetical protein